MQFAGAAASKGFDILQRGFQQVVTMTHEAMGQIDDMSATAAQVGTSVQAWSELEHAAKRSDLEIATLSGGMKKLNVNLAEAAATGKGATASALKAIGLSASDLSAKSPDEALGAIADGIAAVDNPAQKAALAMDIFGKAGVDMVPFLNQGKEGIDALREEAKRLGVDLSDVDAAKVGMANDAMDQMTALITGVGQELAINVAPFITAFAESLMGAGLNGEFMADMIKAGMKIVVQAIAIGADVIDVFVDAFLFARAGITKAIQGITWVVQKMFEGIDAASQKLFGKDSGLGEAFKNVQEELGRTGDELMAEANKSFTDQTPGEALIGWFDQVNAASDANAKKLAEDSKNRQKINKDELAQLAKNAEKLKDLQSEVDMFGKDDIEKELAKLAEDGFGPEQLSEAEALLKTLDNLEKAQDKRKQMEDAAKSIAEANLTPLETYEKELTNLDALRDQDLISERDYERARKKLVKELAEANETPETQFAGAIEANTSAAFSAINASRAITSGRDNGMDAVAGNTRDAVVELKKLNNKVLGNAGTSVDPLA